MKKTIYFLINDISIVGGAERVTSMLSNELVKNYNIKIINLELNHKISYKLNNDIEIININLKLGRSSKLNIIKIINSLINYKFIKESIVIGVGVELSYFLFLLKLKKVKVLAWEHCGFEAGSLNVKRKRKFFYRFLDGVISLTEYDFKKYYKKFNKKSICIPNFLTFESLKKAELKNKRMIAVGRLSHEKGFDKLIEIWKMFENDLEDWEIDIYGEGPEKEKLVKRCNELGLNRFFFKGTTKNIQLKMYESSICVMTSRYEGLPMVLLEAISCGLPCISFDCPTGPSEIIKDSKNGYLIKMDDNLSFKEKLIKLANSTELREDMGENSKKISKKFLKEVVIKKWENYLEKL